MTERLHFNFSLTCVGEGNGNPLQYSCLENPRDWGAWWAAVYGVAQSRTRLKWLSSSSSSSKRARGNLWKWWMCSWHWLYWWACMCIVSPNIKVYIKYVQLFISWVCLSQICYKQVMLLPWRVVTASPRVWMQGHPGLGVQRVCEVAARLSFLGLLL